MDGFTVGNSNKFLNTGEIRDLKTTTFESPKTSDAGASGESFVDTLKNAIGETNELQKIADIKMQDLATGRTDNIPDVMMAAEKADISLKLMMQVRSKIIDAYQEVMKMPV